MSIESRVEQFHVDSQRPKDNKTEKDIAKLQKFLFKNQEHRFADREQTYLFQAVQAYVNKFADGTSEDNPALPLLEDALKMPFTVFTTSQKKSMLKMLDRLAGQAPGKQQPGGAQKDAPVVFDVLDCDDARATFMSADGETVEVPLADLAENVRQAIVSGLEADEPVEVTHTASEGWQLRGGSQ